MGEEFDQIWRIPGLVSCEAGKAGIEEITRGVDRPVNHRVLDQFCFVHLLRSLIIVGFTLLEHVELNLKL